MKKKLPESCGDHNPPQIIIYETDDKDIRVSVRIEDETVWLTQQQVSELYGTSRPNVTMHIKNIFSDGELNEDAVCKKCLQTAADGKNYEVLFYNLDMIISLGNRRGPIDAGEGCAAFEECESLKRLKV